MIQNEHQYKVTQGEIKKLQQALDTLLEQADSMQPIQISSIQKSFQQQIDQMQAELQEYSDLKAGKLEITMGSIEDLPKVLIQKRISLGMTQRELAEKLGIKEQMVQRYESTAYESISYQRLIEVWNALEASIAMMVVRGTSLNGNVCQPYPSFSRDEPRTSKGQTISQSRSEHIYPSNSLKARQAA